MLLDLLPQLVAKAKALTSGWGIPGWVREAIRDDERERTRRSITRRAAAAIALEDDDEDALLLLVAFARGVRR